MIKPLRRPGQIAAEWLKTEDTSELDIELEASLLACGLMQDTNAIVGFDPGTLAGKPVLLVEFEHGDCPVVLFAE